MGASEKRPQKMSVAVSTSSPSAEPRLQGADEDARVRAPPSLVLLPGLGDLRITGGRGGEDDGDGTRLRDVATGKLAERRELAGDVGGLDEPHEGLARGQRDVVVVTDDGAVDAAEQQRGLAPLPEHRLHGDAGGLGDVPHRGGGVAAVEEAVPGRVEDGDARALRLFLAQRRSVHPLARGHGLTLSCRHSLESNSTRKDRR